MFVARVGLHVVGLERHRGAELPRDPERALPAVGHVGVLRNRRLLLQVSQQAARRVGDVAEARQRLRVGRRRTVERVRHEIGAHGGVVDGNDGDRQHTLRPEDIGVDHVVVVQAGSAAQHGAIVHRVGEAEPRLNVVGVLRTASLLRRLEHRALRERVPDQVVARAEIQRQLPRQLPVVLRPRAVLPHVERRQEVRCVGYAERVARRDGRDRIEVPRVRIVPHREQRLDVGGNRSAVGRHRAHAPVAVARVVQGVKVLAAGFQVVMAARVVGEREVVVERIDVLVPVARQVRVAGD